MQVNRVITISREFGSGGRELGIKLAKKLNIPFYDKELISLAAEQSGLSEESFLHYDENIPATKSDDQHYSQFSSIYDISMSDQIFFAQTRVIRKLAEQGSCIIVGRCADRVLRESINLFVYANIEERIQRIVSIHTGEKTDCMERRVREIDKRRKDYYQYYTGNEWGKSQNYDLCINSSLVGIEGCLKTVLAYLRSLS
jgi:cytidylate kinase